VIYVISLVLKWLEEKIGGLEAIEKINRERRRSLYDFMDQSASTEGLRRRRAAPS